MGKNVTLAMMSGRLYQLSLLSAIQKTALVVGGSYLSDLSSTKVPFTFVINEQFL